LRATLQGGWVSTGLYAGPLQSVLAKVRSGTVAMGLQSVARARRPRASTSRKARSAFPPTRCHFR